MCGVCNNVDIKIFSLTPKDDEELIKLEKRLGDESNWQICENCIKRLEHEINCMIIITDAETVADYEFEHYDKEDLKYEKDVIDKINDRIILCPMCNKEMSIDIELIDSQDIEIFSGINKAKISCSKCGFIYSDKETFTICGEIIDFNKKCIMLKPVMPPPHIEDLVDKPILDMIKLNQGVKGIVYLNDNLNLKALKTLQDLGLIMEFLVINGKIVRIIS